MSRILPDQLHARSEPLDTLEISTIPEFEPQNEASLESRTDDDRGKRAVL